MVIAAPLPSCKINEPVEIFLLAASEVTTPAIDAEVVNLIPVPVYKARKAAIVILPPGLGFGLGFPPHLKLSKCTSLSSRSNICFVVVLLVGDER